MHQFLSPLEQPAQGFLGRQKLQENRTRLLREDGQGLALWPCSMLLAKAVWVRLSATDWAEGGWNIDETVKLCGLLKADGIDLIDVSSGGLASHTLGLPWGRSFQVGFARADQEGGRDRHRLRWA